MAGVDIHNLSSDGSERLADCIRHGIDTFIKEPRKREACLLKVRRVIGSSARHYPSEFESEEVSIEQESDILHARTVGHRLLKSLGFGLTDEVKIATVISELARNIFRYAGRGTVTLTKLKGMRRGIEIVAEDSGPGIQDLDKIMAGQYHSTSGLGIGLCGSKKLMDEFSVETERGKGTTVTARKFLT
ncbi:MAG: hypothetical protein EHM61_10175 [Acidobacteria bacterium]|nr:MAG: hypothetical protein EHM61_10175 [Acidobacteriota bacterium]